MGWGGMRQYVKKGQKGYKGSGHCDLYSTVVTCKVSTTILFYMLSFLLELVLCLISVREGK